MDERIDDGVLRWFGYIEKMENDRIAKRVYVGGVKVSRSASRPRKRWIDTTKDLRKKVWMTGKQGELCMIGVNGGGL